MSYVPWYHAILLLVFTKISVRFQNFHGVTKCCPRFSNMSKVFQKCPGSTVNVVEFWNSWLLFWRVYVISFVGNENLYIRQKDVLPFADASIIDGLYHHNFLRTFYDAMDAFHIFQSFVIFFHFRPNLFFQPSNTNAVPATPPSVARWRSTWRRRATWRPCRPWCRSASRSWATSSTTTTCRRANHRRLLPSPARTIRRSPRHLPAAPAVPAAPPPPKPTSSINQRQK